jgi:hypothetical protein
MNLILGIIVFIMLANGIGFWPALGVVILIGLMNSKIEIG